MAPAQQFAGYPTPKEAPASALVFNVGNEGKNPALRGYPIVVASTLVGSSGWLQNYLWHNAGFGEASGVPGLEKVGMRLDPTVIPLSDGTRTQALELGKDLTTPQPQDLPGRFYSIADYHELYKSGKATPLQVVDALLPLIRRDVKPPSKYANAWIHVHAEEALKAAKASTARWAAGKPLGILDGVPFGVKDDTDVKGYVSTYGMKAKASEPFFSTPADETTWPVQKLEDAGAIMIGKNNQHEVGMDTTGCNPTHGTATNWYNPMYYPGGSSSGGASSVCGGVVPITVGTDGGGSTRIPPSFCGVYGLKPSHSRTVNTQKSVVTVGPMASNLSDLIIAYRVMSQPDPTDNVQGAFGLSVPPRPSAKKFIGVWREWLDQAHPAVLQIYNKALDYLTTQAGYQVVDISLPNMRQTALAHSVTNLVEVAAHAKTRTRDPRNWLSLVNAPNSILLSVGAQTPTTDFVKYGQLRQVLMSHLAFLFQKYPGLLIFTPTSPMAGWPVAPGDQAYGFSDGDCSIRNMTYAWIANTSGCPAITCPAGFVDPVQGEGRVPVGIMATGEWGAEEQLFAFARDAETYLHEAYPGGRLRPKEWLDVLGLVGEEA